MTEREMAANKRRVKRGLLRVERWQRGIIGYHPLFLQERDSFLKRVFFGDAKG